MMYLPSLAIINCYFENRLATATAIASSGAGLGTFVFAKLLSLLCDKMGLANTLLIVSSIMFCGFLLSCFYCPITSEDEVKQDQKEKSTTEKREQTSSYRDILRSFPTVLFLVSQFFVSAAYGSYSAFAVDNAVMKGIPETEASYVLGLTGLANIVGKLLFGTVLDCFPRSAFPSSALVYAGLAVAVLLSDTLPSLPAQLACSVLFGLTSGR